MCSIGSSFIASRSGQVLKRACAGAHRSAARLWRRAHRTIFAQHRSAGAARGIECGLRNPEPGADRSTTPDHAQRGQAVGSGARSHARNCVLLAGASERRSTRNRSHGGSGVTCCRSQIIVAGSLARRRYLRNLAFHLWALAYTEKPRLLSVAEFRRVVAESNELARASRRGHIAIKWS